jgi:hypothetical protein
LRPKTQIEGQSLADDRVLQQAALFVKMSVFASQLSNVQAGPSTMSFFEAILSDRRTLGLLTSVRSFACA